MDKRIFVIFTLCVLSTLLLGSTGPVVARPSLQEPPPPQPEGEPWGDQDYLLPLPEIQPDDLEAMNLPPDPSPRQAEEAARSWSERAAERYPSILERLRIEGKISGYEVRLDLNAIVLQGVTDPQGVSEILSGPNEPGIVPARKAATCLARQAGLQGQRIFVLRQLDQELSADAGNITTLASAPMPTIHLVTVDYGYGVWASLVYGKVFPNSMVTVNIVRHGRIIGYNTSQSDRRGGYLFVPGRDCYSKYDAIQPGDAVEVTAAGKTAITIFEDLEAWADPATDTIGGTAPIGSQIEIHLYNHTNTCQQARVYKKVITTPSSIGEFSYSFAGKPDFNGLASAVIYNRDGNGNTTELSVMAYYLKYTLYSKTVSGTLRLAPTGTYTASLLMNGQLETKPVDVDLRGRFDLYFSNAILPGAVLTVNGGDIDLVAIAKPVEITLDAIRNRVSGTGEPGRLVEAHFASNSYYSCNPQSPCRKALVGSDGHFSINAGFDVQRGDAVQINMIDSQGNIQQSFPRHIPVLILNISPYYDWLNGYWVSVDGNWYAPQKHLTIEVLASDHTTVLGSGTRNLGDQDDVYWGWSTPALPVGGFLRVRDEEGITEEMPLVGLNAMFNSQDRVIEGTARTGKLVVRYHDFRPASANWNVFLCQKISVREPAYRLSVRGARVGPGDWAEISHIGPEGNITTSPSIQAFRMKMFLYTEDESAGSHVQIFAPYSGEITLNLKDAFGTVLESYTGSVYSDVDSHTDFYFDHAFHAGQTLEAVAPMFTETLTIPVETTILEDSDNNRIYGQTWPKSPIWAYLNISLFVSFDDIYAYQAVRTLSNHTGQYAAKFQGLITKQSYCPVPARVGDPCIEPVLQVYSPSGHVLNYYKAPFQPPVVPQDAYEPDNSPAEAKLYSGPSHHTMPLHDDHEDWVKFMVNPEDLGLKYVFETYQLDTNMSTNLYLLDTDGSTYLAYGNDGPAGSQWLEYIFSKPGTYYMLIEGFNEISCKETYDFRITKTAPSD